MGRRLMFFGLGFLVVGCSAGPTAPSAVAAGATAMAVSADSSGEQASHALPLTSSSGEVFGKVNVTLNARTGTFTLNSQDSISVRGLPGNLLLHVLGSGDTGLPGGQQADGICQRAQAGFFAPLSVFPGGPAATIETSPGGAGTVHVVDGRNSPFLSDGTLTDIRIRVVDALPPAAPTIDLRTPCFTIEVK